MKTILKPSILTVTAILLTSVLSFNATPPDCSKYTNGELVYFPDPDDCQKFWTCDNGHAIPLACPDGLCFNPAIEACDWPQKVGTCTVTTICYDVFSGQRTCTVSCTGKECSRADRYVRCDNNITYC